MPNLPRLVTEESPTNRLRLLRIHSRFVGAKRKLILCYMRLPQPLIESQFFSFVTANDLARAMSEDLSVVEGEELRRLAEARLPPITSMLSLSTMLGINQGLLWSMVNNSKRHYRKFQIPKGAGFREITAPRVALKIVQKWLSYHLASVFQAKSHVHGFVPGRSHVTAAACHSGAEWVASFDIENFFPTTPEFLVKRSLCEIGYSVDSSSLIAKVCCLEGFLPQGSPSSPVLSNMCMSDLDVELAELAAERGCTLTRYADDITFSGAGKPPYDLVDAVSHSIERTPWALSERKLSLVALPKRLKVHGLLVHGDRVRLTKGYRNKLRLYRYLVSKRVDLGARRAQYVGHLQYGRFVEDFSAENDE